MPQPRTPEQPGPSELRPGSSEPGPAVREFLGARFTMALATDGPEGLWVASVFFAADLAGRGVRLYFLSSPSSRHGRNLAANPAVAAAINEDEHDWRAIRGIQLEGTCEPVDVPLERLHAWRVYLAKFPVVRDLFRAPGLVGEGGVAKLRRTRMYRLLPRRIYYLDNRLGFGSRQDVSGLLGAR